MKAFDPTFPFWNATTADLAAALDSSPAGLSAVAAADRLKRLGPNAIDAHAELSAITLLLRQFRSPLVLILVVGAAVSLMLRVWVDAAIILVVVLGSTFLGFIQEYRASAAVRQLRQRLVLTSQVLRDGKTLTIPASAIVPGDVVLLSAGNLVPADGLVLAARDFLVVEASLTGESAPVEKSAAVLPVETPLSQRTNAVFLGTSVRSGTATVLVARTGQATAFGAVAGRLRRAKPESEFARGIERFGYLLVRVMILMVFFVLTVNQFLGRPFIESLLFAVALTVGMSPELLPAIIVVTLSAGARSMAARGVVVRRLEAIENLGIMDVLCTDKTGTITEGALALTQSTGPDGGPSPETLRLAFLNAGLETGIANPLDEAIVAAGKQAGLTVADHTKLDEIPYDFSRKCLTIVVAEEEQPDACLIVTKGAFANVLALCTTVLRQGSEAALDDGAKAALQSFYEARGAEGLRVIAVASRRVEAKARYGPEDEREMAFVGFLLFSDPPKPEARQTISDLSEVGIRVKIVTGDNRHVAAHVAAAVGLDPEAMLTGTEIDRLSEVALGHRAEHADLFVEVDPQQKERIVRALQHGGHAVGYLGDGINDAPSLIAADVGISVDQAVDVARESADVVLLRPDLEVLKRGVEDGRRTFVNTLKYISITTSANFGNMVSMAVVTPLLPFLPLAAKQILLNNLLSDLPSMALSTDNVEAERLKHVQRWNIREVRRFMVLFGLTSTIFDFLSFALLLFAFRADMATFQTAWFVVSLLTELAVVLVLRTAGPALHSSPSRLLLGTTAAVATLALAIPYIPPIAGVFAFVPLPASLVAALAAIVIAYLVATEAAKRFFFGRLARSAGARRHGAAGPMRHNAGGSGRKRS